MSNHVHVLVKPLGNYSITDILHSWKSYTANEINKLLERKGQVWMHESYDHIVRNEKAFEAIRQYIRNNPKGKSTSSIPAGEGSFQSKDALGTLSLRAVTLQKEDKANIDAAVKEKGVVLTKLSGDVWFIGSDAEQRLKEKIERIGKPLKEWDVKIYRGVLTGLNEAFIITTEKRNEILANCHDEAERQLTEAIIKPILRGRDIKRYHYEWAGLWLIGTFPALKLNIEDYPAIKKYFLDNFDIRQLEQSGKKYPELGFDARKKTGNKWFETQDQIAYYPEFEKENVVYSETIKIYFDGKRNYSRFCYDDKQVFLDKTTFFITGLNNKKYLLGFFNSKVSEYLLENGYCIKLGSGGRGLQKILIEKIPLPPITPTNKPIVRQIEALVDKILEAKQNTSSIQCTSSILAGATTTSRSKDASDTLELEREIDELVYKLYDLTEEEKMIIEKIK